MTQNNKLALPVPNIEAGETFMRDIIKNYENVGYLSLHDIYSYMNGTDSYVNDLATIEKNNSIRWTIDQLKYGAYRVVSNPGFNNALILIEHPNFIPDNQDMVNHPKHYVSKNGIEVIDVIQAFTEGLSGIEATDTGNIIKYACRWKTKNGIEDLKKLVWYANHLIEHLEGDKK